jgi:hypothetical protein
VLLMNAATTWLADRVASLLPQTSAAACIPFSICSFGACGSRTLFQCCSRRGFVSCNNTGLCC